MGKILLHNCPCTTHQLLELKLHGILKGAVMVMVTGKAKGLALGLGMAQHLKLRQQKVRC